jgi:hypothetical protein
MAGFEVVVRPVVFPNIRPPQAKPVLPADDPTQGQCVISGASGEIVTLNESWNYNQSKSRPVETKRRSDLARVYQKEDDGTVNKDNFIDVKVANKIQLREGNQPGRRQFVEWDPNYPDKRSQSLPDGYMAGTRIVSLKKAQEADNIEIKQRDIGEDNPDAGSDN